MGCRVQWVWWALPCPWRSEVHISKPPPLRETEWFNGDGRQGSTEPGLYIQISLIKREWHLVKGWTLQDQSEVAEEPTWSAAAQEAWAKKGTGNFFPSAWLLHIIHLSFVISPKNKTNKQSNKNNPHRFWRFIVRYLHIPIVRYSWDK